MSAFVFLQRQPTERCLRFGRTIDHCLSSPSELRAKAARRHPVFGDISAMCIMLCGLGIVAATQVVPLLVQPFGGNAQREIAEADARKVETALTDSKGRWFEDFLYRLDSDRWSNQGGTVKFDDTDLSGKGSPIYPVHKVLFVEQPPQHYLICLKRLEGSNMRDRRPQSQDYLVAFAIAAIAQSIRASSDPINRFNQNSRKEL